MWHVLDFGPGADTGRGGGRENLGAEAFPFPHPPLTFGLYFATC